MSKSRTITIVIASILTVLSVAAALVLINSFAFAVWLSAVPGERNAEWAERARYRFWPAAAFSIMALAAIVWLIVLLARRWRFRGNP